MASALLTVFHPCHHAAGIGIAKPRGLRACDQNRCGRSGEVGLGRDGVDAVGPNPCFRRDQCLATALKILGRPAAGCALRAGGQRRYYGSYDSPFHGDARGFILGSEAVTSCPECKRQSVGDLGGALGVGSSDFSKSTNASAVRAAPISTRPVGAGRPSAISHRITQLGIR